MLLQTEESAIWNGPPQLDNNQEHPAVEYREISWLLHSENEERERERERERAHRCLDPLSMFHSHSQVLNPQSSIPGLTVEPASGCVPVGGSVELQLKLHPTVVRNFDGWVKVKLREGKVLKVRVAGRVESPNVTVDKVCGDHACTVNHSRMWILLTHTYRESSTLVVFTAAMTPCCPSLSPTRS